MSFLFGFSDVDSRGSVRWPDFLLLCWKPRYELAQQLQPQSGDDPLGTGGVTHDMPVEMEAESLQQGTTTTVEQQGMLGLGQTEVVNGGPQVSLDAPLTDQALVQGEGNSKSKTCLVYFI